MGVSAGRVALFVSRVSVDKGGTGAIGSIGVSPPAFGVVTAGSTRGSAPVGAMGGVVGGCVGALVLSLRSLSAKALWRSRVSCGLVVIKMCSSGEATTFMATWFWPAKKRASPTSAVKRRCLSPWER